jgi:hypothetical protein
MTPGAAMPAPADAGLNQMIKVNLTTTHISLQYF